MPAGTVVSTPASGSSNPVPNAHCPSPPWAWSSASYTVSSCAMRTLFPGHGVPGRWPSPRGPPPRGTSGGGEGGGPSHVGDVVRDLVERRVAVDLVAARREHRVLLVGARRGDVRGLDHPDAHALVAPRVDIAGGVH